MMKSILAVVLLFGVALAAFSEKEYEVAFTNWMQENNKAYTAEEFKNRFAIFSDNMDFVEEWNSRGHSHKVGLNALADITNQEYQELYLMKNPVDATRRLAQAGPFTPKVSSPADDDVNWVTKGAVTPIKDQGQCGSCWSFSTTGAIEGATQITTGTLVSLSEQNLVDCSTQNDGCNGGEPTVAMQYVIDNKGIDLENSYPAYTASQGQCRFEASWVGALITGYTQVTAGDEDDLKSKTDEQPVSVAIDASHQSFQLYTSGIYNESNCSTSNLDHAVLVVGYGTDTGDYWFVKNSWGTSWGLQGYIKMSRNAENQCGIASDAAIATGASLPSTTSASGNSNSNSGTSQTSSGSSGQTSSGSSGQTSSGNSNSGNSAATNTGINTGKTATNTGKTATSETASSGQTSSGNSATSGSSGQTSSGNSNSGNSATNGINTGKTATNTGKTSGTTQTSSGQSSSSGQSATSGSSGQTATSTN